MKHQVKHQGLPERIEAYLAFRHRLGFSLESARWLLVDFAHHMDRIGHPGQITTDLAVQWALSSHSNEPEQAARRLSVIRSFTRYCAVFDPANEIPPVGLIGRVSRRRKQPHIYTDAEITALLHEAGRLLPRGGLRPSTYVAFFSFLVSTGLRLSEACRLTVSDVDLTNGVVTIREGKFRKSRLVPLHRAPRTLSWATSHTAMRTLELPSRVASSVPTTRQH